MSSTWAITRAWLVPLPFTGTQTSKSTIWGGRACDRYWAVAQTTGRPQVPSMAWIAAARPTPPNMNPPPGGPTQRSWFSGRYQRWGLCVAWSLKNGFDMAAP